MKTTIDIPEPLLEAARQVASREGTTLKVLIASGLRRELAERAKEQPFVLRDASFGGSGLQVAVGDSSWQELVDLSYLGRGG